MLSPFIVWSPLHQSSLQTYGKCLIISVKGLLKLHSHMPLVHRVMHLPVRTCLDRARVTRGCVCTLTHTSSVYVQHTHIHREQHHSTVFFRFITKWTTACPIRDTLIITCKRSTIIRIIPPRISSHTHRRSSRSPYPKHSACGVA